MPAPEFLCELSALQQQPSLGINVGDQRYIVINSDNEPKVYLNNCPHLGIPLEWQEHQFIDNDTGLIRCATHGALFLTSNGECVSGPCVGDALLSVPSYVEGGSLYLGPKPE